MGSLKFPLGWLPSSDAGVEARTKTDDEEATEERRSGNRREAFTAGCVRAPGTAPSSYGLPQGLPRGLNAWAVRKKAPAQKGPCYCTGGPPTPGNSQTTPADILLVAVPPWCRDKGMQRRCY